MIIVTIIIPALIPIVIRTRVVMFIVIVILMVDGITGVTITVATRCARNWEGNSHLAKWQTNGPYGFWSYAQISSPKKGKGQIEW